jgi:hypothetical protein
LHGTDIPDRLQVADIFPEEALQPFLLPTSESALGLCKAGFRESAIGHQDPDRALFASLRDRERSKRLHCSKGPLAGHLGIGEWVKAVVMIAPLEGIPPLSVYIHTSAAGYEEAEVVPVLVEFPLDPAFPFSPFVELIQNQEGLPGRPAGLAYLPAVFPIIPI